MKKFKTILNINIVCIRDKIKSRIIKSRIIKNKKINSRVIQYRRRLMKTKYKGNQLVKRDQREIH